MPSGGFVVAIAHPKHPLAKEKFISVATLAGERLILGEQGGNTRRMIDDFFAAANVRPNVVMELSRQEAINRMVENKMGVGIAGAKHIAKEIREKRLVSWLIEGAEIKWDLGLARLRGGYFSPIAKEFVDSAARVPAMFAENELLAGQCGSADDFLFGKRMFRIGNGDDFVAEQQICLDIRRFDGQ